MKTFHQTITTFVASTFLCVSAHAEPDAPAAPAQKRFDSPQQAAESLIDAAQSFKIDQLKEILGPDSEDILASQDPVMDKERAIEFAALAKQKHAIEMDPENPNAATLAVGEDAFPFPIPIIKLEDKWIFDTEAGRDEILNRRIGANELSAITICHGYVEAQHEYAAETRDGSRIHQYAQRIISSAGKQDGLAWKNEDGSWGGPIGEEIAKALDQGYTQQNKPQPYHGYYFKILRGQGASAPLGRLDFVIKDCMIGGFALAAAPAEYQVTGVKTFIVSHTGIVYEKDLGPETLDAFAKMELFEPDDSWQPTEDAW